MKILILLSDSGKASSKMIESTVPALWPAVDKLAWFTILSPTWSILTVQEEKHLYIHWRARIFLLGLWVFYSFDFSLYFKKKFIFKIHIFPIIKRKTYFKKNLTSKLKSRIKKVKHMQLNKTDSRETVTLLKKK